jgi:phosphonoacetate hydrolase
MAAAIDLLKNRPDLGCLYIHTTDYPMHTWPPEAKESKDQIRDGSIAIDHARSRRH